MTVEERVDRRIERDAAATAAELADIENEILAAQDTSDRASDAEREAFRKFERSGHGACQERWAIAMAASDAAYGDLQRLLGRAHYLRGRHNDLESDRYRRRLVEQTERLDQLRQGGAHAAA